MPRVTSYISSCLLLFTSAWNITTRNTQIQIKKIKPTFYLQAKSPPPVSSEHQRVSSWSAPRSRCLSLFSTRTIKARSWLTAVCEPGSAPTDKEAVNGSTQETFWTLVVDFCLWTRWLPATCVWAAAVVKSRFTSADFYCRVIIRLKDCFSVFNTTVFTFMK